MKPATRYTLPLLTALLLAGNAALAGENATAIKTDSLRDRPFSDAKTVATLNAGSPVEILKREGGWYQIKSAQGSGWIRMLSLRKGDAGKPAAGASASSLASLASGRAGTGKVVSTTGIRGLNEEELKAAHFDEKQVSLAESYQVSRAEAQKFAASAKLKPAKLDYLP
ncbi:MAG: SH3 domain-containing protein [Gallionella sp.]|nr:SH3 domain-containing protein [Gallionella sp.]MDD4947863.1 SH3 domain-containing protein [Gallionella sp.]MDD5611735.1 SH3 domain-containing protein [Gallionella sp.]